MKFESIQQMREAYYGPADSEIAMAVQKADAPVLSTTTGVYNRVYGEAVWELLNNEARSWGVLPKKPLQNTGFRVITARSSTLGTGASLRKQHCLPRATPTSTASTEAQALPTTHM